MFERINGQLMNVVSFGSGEPTLLLVGGWIGPWQVWRQTVELLTSDHRCVAYDHRGAGQTVTDPGQLTFEGLVDDVFAVMDQLDIERAWLGGESQGGLVACAAALRDPSRFHGQFLIGSAAEVTFEEPQQRFADMLETEDAGSALSMFVDLVITETDADHYKRWLLAMLLEAEPGAGSALLRSLAGTSIKDELGLVSIRTLVIHGLDDRVVPPEHARALAAGIPGARLELLADVGHVPTITGPRTTAALVRDFIATNPVR